MTIKTLKDEDKFPIKGVLKAVSLKMAEVLRVVDALNLGRTEVKADGVYRTFNDGHTVQIAVGNFKKRKISNKRIKLF